MTNCFLCLHKWYTSGSPGMFRRCLLLVLMALSINGCAEDIHFTDERAPTEAIHIDKIRSGIPIHGKTSYRITGSAGVYVDVTYRVGNGQTRRHDNVLLPWQIDVPAGKGEYLYVAAKSRESAASVTCSILHNDRINTEMTLDGAYVLVQCNGFAQ